MPTAYITHSDCSLHDMGQFHPEQPARLAAILDALHEAQLMDFLIQYEAPLGTEDQILLAHTQQHIDFLRRQSPQSGLVSIDPDTSMNCHTLKAALRAVGAATLGVELIMEMSVDNAFCAVRPPGHHAERDKAMGFCFFNNIAIAAKYVLQKYHLKRVAILDFDVHHGNGTEKILKDDSRVLICSTFQHPFYPGTEIETANPQIINAPLPAGSDGTYFRDAIDNKWIPALDRFRPEFILISAGFDAHRNDPLADLKLTAGDFAWVTERAMTIATKYSSGRILSILEGGYELASLGRCTAAHIRTLMQNRAD